MKERRRSSRREFLQGQSALDAVEAMLPDHDSPPGERPATRPAAADSFGPEHAEQFLIEVSRRAMACDFQVLMNARQHQRATEAAMRALDVVETLEDQMTVYRSHSEVSRINQTAAAGPVAVEHRLFALLRRAYDLSEATGGAFDITAGPLIRAWGFYRREGRFPEASDANEALASVGYRHLEFDESQRTIRFLRAGMEINLGAIGKGYALDQCASRLENEGVENFILHGGKSSILARGERANEASHGRGWSIALRDPLKPEKQLALLWLRDRAVGTSGDANQFFYHQGRRYGHVIDPRTGFPSQGVLSATVITSNAAEADALATALFVMPKDEAIEFCLARTDTSLLLLTPGSRHGETELAIVNLASESVEVIQPHIRVNWL